LLERSNLPAEEQPDVHVPIRLSTEVGVRHIGGHYDFPCVANPSNPSLGPVQPFDQELATLFMPVLHHVRMWQETTPIKAGVPAVADSLTTNPPSRHPTDVELITCRLNVAILIL
jgi:hypothetical protein